MEPVYIPIMVALIGGPVMWFLSRFDKRNTEQHGQNMEILEKVDIKIDQMNWKIDRMDGKVDRVDEKVERLDNRVTTLESPKATVRRKKIA